LSTDSVLDRIAEIILNHPSASVAFIAQALGYAEEKSVYYWLHKAGYRSAREFRAAVLTGRFPRRLPRPPDRLGETPGPAWDQLPVAEAVAPGRVQYTGSTLAMTSALLVSQSGFAIRLESAEDAPLFLPGDFLVVDPAGAMDDAALVVAWLEGHGACVCRYYAPRDTTILLHPVTGLPCPGRPAVLGRVVALVRPFGP
jgi:SOS-response transcriptional repressor LexA